jgi:phage gp16-like protein
MKTAKLAKIHIAKKDLGLDDDTYRQMLRTVTGKDSAKALTLVECDKVLAHCKKLGWTPKASTKPKIDTDWRAPRIKLIKDLWSQLGEAGALRNPSNEGLLNFCKPLMTVPKLEWATSQSLNHIVEALKAWLARVEKAGA